MKCRITKYWNYMVHQVVAILDALIVDELFGVPGGILGAPGGILYHQHIAPTNVCAVSNSSLKLK